MTQTQRQKRFLGKQKATDMDRNWESGRMTFIRRERKGKKKRKKINQVGLLY